MDTGILQITNEEKVVCAVEIVTKEQLIDFCERLEEQGWKLSFNNYDSFKKMRVWGERREFFIHYEYCKCIPHKKMYIKAHHIKDLITRKA